MRHTLPPSLARHGLIARLMHATALMLLCGAAALAQPVRAATETPQLNVICDLWAPYQMVVDGRLDGFSTQVVRRIFERLDVAVRETRVYPWKRAIIMLERGAADALFSANYTDARSEFALYPEQPLVETPWELWTSRELAATYHGLDDLRGHRVGVVRGYSYTPEFWAFVERHQVYEAAESDEQNFRKLQAGRLDFVIAEHGNAHHIIERMGMLDSAVPITAHPIKSDGIYIIFSKARVSPELVERFSVELARFKQEPEYQQLLRDYLGEGQTH
ncbi:transporter substrate-binding domain-containing protein [Marichromatium sp. PS1]|uniref:substrate-binding periplasmic protein n=1 Tax=Marichromatium sp. PS1 TaxID=3138932 RepID=UPI0032E7A12F